MAQAVASGCPASGCPRFMPYAAVDGCPRFMPYAAVDVGDVNRLVVWEVLAEVGRAVDCGGVWLVDCNVGADVDPVGVADEVGVVVGALAAEMFMPYVGAGSGSLWQNPSKCSLKLLDAVAASCGPISPYIISGANVTANPYMPLDGASELEAWASQCSDADALPLWHPGNGQL